MLTDNGNATDSDIPPTVGIGFVQPSDAADVVPIATDSELIDELEEDDRVTGKSCLVLSRGHWQRICIIGFDTLLRVLRSGRLGLKSLPLLLTKLRNRSHKHPAKRSAMR